MGGWIGVCHKGCVGAIRLCLAFMVGMGQSSLHCLFFKVSMHFFTIVSICGDVDGCASQGECGVGCDSAYFIVLDYSIICMGESQACSALSSRL